MTQRTADRNETPRPTLQVGLGSVGTLPVAAVTTEKEGATTRLLSRIFRLLDVLAERSGSPIGLSELAKRAELPMSTTHRLVRILMITDKVERGPSGYRLRRPTQRTDDLPDTSSSLRDRMLPAMLDLYEKTQGAAVHLAVLDGSKVRYLEKLAGRGSIRLPSRRGGVAPAHCTALGKALLAGLAEPLASLDAALCRFTPATITTKAVLAAELAEVRQSGIAVDRGEFVTGVTCVAAPFRLPGQRQAAVSVSSAVGRLDTRMAGQHIRRILSALSAPEHLR
ncbi:MAG TPA: IclR family transcriptional regulator [Amycolatopsis sp.]|nr:IclR family transcriptional regulator [Amycolatopsis sp.]